MTTYGLFIGTDYRGTSNQLAGCVNDAIDWHLRFRGACAGGDTIKLLDSDATKVNIVASLRRILALLKAGDTAIITFSGHGTHLPDRDGDEADGQDEALCPHDLTKNLILDDELRVILSARDPSSRVLLITDCCHSGTIARGPTEERGLPRYVPFAELTNQGMCSSVVDGLRRDAAEYRSRRAPDDGLTHFSGCADHEYSYDATFNGRPNGAFSYFALRAMNSQDAPRGLTCEAWHRAIRKDLPSTRYPQTPLLNGTFTLIVPGFEPPVTAPPNANTAGPGVDVVVGTWRAKTWERV